MPAGQLSLASMTNSLFFKSDLGISNKNGNNKNSEDTEPVMRARARVPCFGPVGFVCLLVFGGWVGVVKPFCSEAAAVFFCLPTHPSLVIWTVLKANSEGIDHM